MAACSRAVTVTRGDPQRRLLGVPVRAGLPGGFAA